MTQKFDLSGTSPAAASTVASKEVTGLNAFTTLRLDAVILGATGGTLDVYIQRKVAANVWVDWVHFTQLAAAAAAVTYSLTFVAAQSASLATATTAGTDSTPAPAIAASIVAIHPGNHVRVVYVAGAGTSAGAAQSIALLGMGPTK